MFVNPSLRTLFALGIWNIGQTMQKKRLDMNLNSRSASGSLSEACVQMDSTLSQTMPENPNAK